MKKLLSSLFLCVCVFGISQAFAQGVALPAAQDSAYPAVLFDESTDITTSSSGFGIIGLLTPLFIYLFYAICSYTLFSKLRIESAWLAWIPGLAIIPSLRSANMSLWWILGLFVPLLNIYVLIRMTHHGMSVPTGHGAGWTIGLIFLGVIFLPITALTYQAQNTPTARV